MLFNNEVANTLFIPLTMKAVENRKSNGLFHDHQADELVTQFGIDLPDMNQLMNAGTQLGTVARVKSLDDRTANFIRQHENALVVTIGCGMDNRLLRLNAAHTHALNIDLPEVLNIRKQYVTEISSLVINKDFSIFSTGWVNFIKQRYGNCPVIFIAEGVLMYFTEQQVTTIIDLLKTNFCCSEFWFDSSSQAANDIMNQRQDFKKLGVSFKWSLDNPESLQDNRFQLIESVAIMDCYPEIWADVYQHAPEVFKQGSRINGYRLV